MTNHLDIPLPSAPGKALVNVIILTPMALPFTVAVTLISSGVPTKFKFEPNVRTPVLVSIDIPLAACENVME